MTAHMEVWKTSGVELVALTPPRLTIGRGPGNDITLEHDRMVSQLHAVVEAFGDGWVIRDLGSTNGTFLRGERVLTDRALRHGDELLMGRTRIVYRTSELAPTVPTEFGNSGPPELTRRERDVLNALCRPLATGQTTFTEPASLRQIAAELVVTEAAVKQHLARLYDKFGLTERRRVQLANEAIRRGAVTLANLRDERS
ncbi:MAG: FHA domain-containing protein [Pseudonocardia sp.]